MAKTKVLIAVKTYPSLSSKYDELVCTAGFLEDGSWIRIYPIPFRKLDYDNQYKKYQWVEIDIEKNMGDFRPESHKLLSHDIKTLGFINTDNNWQERKKLVLNKVYDNMTDLINEAKDKNICTSLAVFKPTKILDFIVEKTEREWDKKKLGEIMAKRNQLSLFGNENYKEIIDKLPYKFSYVFEDINGKQSTLIVEDWELGALFWKYSNENEAIEKVKGKYKKIAKENDVYLFLGTTKLNHYISRNPFVIIGVFYPPKIKENPQLSLF